MAPLTDTGRRAGGYIVGEAAGADGPYYSRESVTYLTGAVYEPGMVLGVVTASGKYAPHDPAAVDGSETAAAVAYGFYDASGGDVEGVASVRRTTVRESDLIWDAGATAQDITDGLAALAANGIVAR